MQVFDTSGILLEQQHFVQPVAEPSQMTLIQHDLTSGSCNAWLSAALHFCMVFVTNDSKQLGYALSTAGGCTCAALVLLFQVDIVGQLTYPRKAQKETI